MKLRKLYLTTLLAMFALAGCQTPSQDVIDLLPEDNVIQKEGHNIKKIEFKNIPADGILRGMFDSYDIYLLVTYDDDSTLEHHLTMRSLSPDLRDILDTEGDHVVKILFRGQEVVAHFNILHSDKLYHIEYRDYQGNLLQIFEVQPGEQLPFIPDSPDREEDYYCIYDNKGWDTDLSGQNIHEDHQIYPKYEKKFKRSHSFSSKAQTDAFQNRFLDKTLDGNKDAMYFHLGRFYHAPLYVAKLDGTAGSVYHKTTSTPASFTAKFESIDLSTTGSWIQYVGVEQMMKSFLTSQIIFDANLSPTQLNPWKNEDAVHILSGTDPRFQPQAYEKDDVETLLHNHTTTYFDNLEGEYELFKTYVADYLVEHADYLNDIKTNGFNFSIPASSDEGYYRVVYECDMDVVYCLRSNFYEDELELYHVEPYFLVDPNSFTVRVDYDSTGDFNPTQKFEYSFNGACQDYLWAKEQ